MMLACKSSLEYVFLGSFAPSPFSTVPSSLGLSHKDPLDTEDSFSKRSRRSSTRLFDLAREVVDGISGCCCKFLRLARDLISLSDVRGTERCISVGWGVEDDSDCDLWS